MAKRQHIDLLTRGHATGKPYIDLQLRPVELQAIGRVTTNWAFLEFLILQETKNLAKHLKIPLPEEAKHISFEHRLDAWERLSERALAAELDEERQRALACIAGVKAVQDERHQLTHRIIEYNPTDRNKLAAYKRGDFLDRKFAWRFDAARIEKTARTIARLSYDILSIHVDLAPPPDALQQKRGRRDRSDH